MPTKQETFDTVVAHLRKQGVRSVNEYGRCSYRGQDGHMCAVGCLIPDIDYEIEMEGGSPYCCALSRVLKARGYEDLELLLCLQRVHDHYDPSDWEAELSELATDQVLIYTPPSMT